MEMKVLRMCISLCTYGMGICTVLGLGGCGSNLFIYGMSSQWNQVTAKSLNTVSEKKVFRETQKLWDIGRLICFLCNTIY